MDLNSFQRKAVLFLFISILAGAVLLSRKEHSKNRFIERLKGKPIKHSIRSGFTSNENHQSAGAGLKKSSPIQSKKLIKIDINTADIALLEELPGIGPALAERIARYRKQHGIFQSLNDLQNVPGIGEKRIEKIRNKINLQKTESKEKQNTVLTKIDLNNASEKELMQITGIGSILAHNIVDYRNRNGQFQDIEELLQVPKIGKQIYESIKGYFYIIHHPAGPITAEPKKAGPVVNTLINTNKPASEIDTSLRCPYCGKALWEKGQKKKIYIRCPHCMRQLPKDFYTKPGKYR